MNCKKFEKYIVLKSEGLSLKEQIELEQHLQTCSSCREFLTATEKSKSLINNIRKNKPILNNPGILTNQIMQSVKKLEKENQVSITNILNQILDWFFVPFVRPVLVSIAVFMISLFIYHESVDQVEIASLEKRLQQYSVVEYMAVQETQSHLLNINTIMKHKGLRTYIISKYQAKINFRNQLSNSGKLINSKSKLLFIKQLKSSTRKPE